MIGNVLNILNMNESCHNGSYNWLPTRDSALCPWVKVPLVEESTSLTSNKSTIFVIGRSRMCLSSLLPLFPRSNFRLRTTPLSSEFVPTTLHIGQWFCVMKSVFSSTISPMQKFLDILTHLWCSCQGPDKFLSPPTPKLITEMLNSSPPTSTIQIRFLENPWWRHYHLCLHCEYII